MKAQPDTIVVAPRHDRPHALSLTRLEVGHGIRLTGSSKFAVEPFENEIVHSNEILDLAHRVRDAVRYDDRAISSGLPIAGLQLQCIFLPDH
jgi:hypothetical protein